MRRSPIAAGVAILIALAPPSNEPAEDEHQEAVVPTPSGYWSFFGIYDGHNGGDTSKWLADKLIVAVVGALADLYSSLVASDPKSDPRPSTGQIVTTLKSTFNRLDDDIVNAPLPTVLATKSKEAAVRLLAPAYSGSCALLAFFDSHSRRLYVALTGDSRAVLGRRRYNEDGTLKYDVYILSTDQNGANEEELARLKAEHPGEHVVQAGRVFGMAVSRAFGDARYKWSRDVQDKLKRHYLGRSPVPDIKTPPYITAEPEVTSIEVQPGDFLIMATDGIWESLTSEEAVGLVGLWKEAEQAGYGKREPIGGYAPHVLPVWMAERDDTVRYRQWGVEKRFVRSDANAATHLLRNALGGADKDLTAGLLNMKTPKARVYRYVNVIYVDITAADPGRRDDMTVSVIFFSEEGAKAGP